MKGSMRMAWGWRVVGLAVALGLLACGPRPPLRIGLLAGLSDRNASFSEDARNGVILAIEQLNAAGGVAGRPLELLVQDHGQGADKSLPAVQALLDARVDAIIGPYASPVATQVLPVVDKARVLMLGPTVTGNSLVGQDDYLVRLNLTNRDSAREAARMLYGAGWRHTALARDLHNADYAAAWSQEFRTAFAALGGTVAGEADFRSGLDASFDGVVRALLAMHTDGLLFVTSSVDAARLAQQVHKLVPRKPMAASGWAANPALIELGGKAVEGMMVAQTYSRADTSPRYRAFEQAYVARFNRYPSYSAIASFDAVLVLHQALDKASAGETLRDAVLRHGPYQGLQQTIALDRFGDAERPAYFTVVRNGQFELLP